MANPLTGKTIAFLCSNEGTEQIELTEPWKAVTDAGATPKLVALEGGKIDLHAVGHFHARLAFAGADRLDHAGEFHEFADDTRRLRAILHRRD